MGFFDVIAGAGAGLLASGGNPIGAAVGGLAGLAGGGDHTQRTTQQLRPFSRNEQRVVGKILAQYPGVIEGMSRAERDALAREFAAMIEEEGLDQVERTFDRARTGVRQTMARTGGGPSSIMSYHMGELGREEATARAGVSRQARLAGEQIASSRVTENMNRSQTLAQALANMHQVRTVGAGSTTTIPNTNRFGPAFGMMGYALGDPESAFNQSSLGDINLFD